MANYPEDHRAKPQAVHFEVSQFFDPQAQKGAIKETEWGKSSPALTKIDGNKLSLSSEDSRSTGYELML